MIRTEVFFLQYVLLLVYGLRRTAATRGKPINTCYSKHVPMQYMLVPDSLSTGFAFLEALSSMVDMVQGHYDSRCGGPACVCCAGHTSSPHTTTSAAAVCTIPTHFVHIYNVISYMEPFLAFLKTDSYKHFLWLHRSQWTYHVEFSKGKKKAKNVPCF